MARHREERAKNTKTKPEMIPIIPTIIATKASLEILQKAKEWFYPNKTLREAEAILSKRIADDVGSLQEQMRTHRQVIDKLVEQVKADKDLIEKHNEVLIQLSETSQQVAAVLARLRIVSYSAMGLAVLALAAVIVLWSFK
jgi:glutaredoxin 2